MANELILIVEDNEQNQKLAGDVLRFKGYRVRVADTAEAGLQIALQERPDVVLMDIHLPGMNGIQALEKLRADPQTQAIPVLAFTASVMPQDRKEITSAGFNGFLSKPINLKEFLESIAAVLAEGKP